METLSKLKNQEINKFISPAVNTNQNQNEVSSNTNYYSQQNYINKIISLNNLISYLKGKKYNIIGLFILLFTFFIYNGYILSFILGVFFTLFIQLFVVFYFLGFIFTDEKNTNEPTIHNSKNIISLKYSDSEYPGDERNNDLKIFYKTINKKNVSNIEDNIPFSPINKDFYHLEELSEVKIKGDANNEIDLKKINLDPGYYCYCKFMPENFENLIKMQNDVINNYSDSTVINYLFNI